MRVSALWYGGSSYAAPSEPEGEPFDSISDAVIAFEDRYRNRDGRTPCVTRESEMALLEARRTCQECRETADRAFVKYGTYPPLGSLQCPEHRG